MKIFDLFVCICRLSQSFVNTTSNSVFYYNQNSNKVFFILMNEKLTNKHHSVFSCLVQTLVQHPVHRVIAPSSHLDEILTKKSLSKFGLH